jgi:hypothetical protein
LRPYVASLPDELVDVPLHLQQLADVFSIGKWSRKGQPSGRGGTGTLSVNGKQVAQRSLPRTQPFIRARDEAFDVGLDTGPPQTTRTSKLPFAFTGKLVKVAIDRKWHARTCQDVKLRSTVRL